MYYHSRGAESSLRRESQRAKGERADFLRGSGKGIRWEPPRKKIESDKTYVVTIRKLANNTSITIRLRGSRDDERELLNAIQVAYQDCDCHSLTISSPVSSDMLADRKGADAPVPKPDKSYRRVFWNNEDTDDTPRYACKWKMKPVTVTMF